MDPVYTIIVPLECKQVHFYVKAKFLYHTVFTMTSAVYVNPSCDGERRALWLCAQKLKSSHMPYSGIIDEAFHLMIQ